MGFLSVSKMVRGGGGGRLFEGGDYFKYFGQRGAIIRGRRLIEGRLLFEEIRYLIKTVEITGLREILVGMAGLKDTDGDPPQS